MPRQAHGRPVQPSGSARPAKRKQRKEHGLNALEIAERENPDQIKIRRHRLGEIEEDSDEPRDRNSRDERSSKRRKISAEEDGDEEDGGSDPDGNEWHVGVEEDDEDSDIDSEDAFGESDEDKFAGFTFRGSEDQHPRKTNPKRPLARRRLDLSEAEAQNDAGDEDDEDEEEDDDLGDDAVDLATALDMDQEADEEEVNAKKHRKSKHDTRSDSYESEAGGAHEDGGSDNGSDDEEDELHSDFSVSVSDEGDGDHSRLQNFVESLGGSSQANPARPERRQLKTLPTKPTQFGLGASKISAEDLLQYVKDPRQRQSLKVLQNSERSGPENYTGGIPGRLAPPLAKRQQQRLDRVAAYDASKKELSKWVDTVKRNRRAEHLSFPLPDSGAISASSAQQLAPISQSQPMTSLETKIQEIMQESGLAPKDGQSAEEREQAYEELQEKKMSLEEVQARRAELRKARDLMFREEIRARRLKKIKSKAFRRVHRKERDRAGLEERALLAAQGLFNSDEERERNDRRRAEERMGARHRESKWAKAVKSTGRAAWDEDARHGVTDLARRDEELRQRIEGKNVRGSDESEADSESESDEASSQQGFDALEDSLALVNADEFDLSNTRLGSMAFMQKAEAARKAANDAEVRSIRRGMYGEEEQPDQEPESEGRQKFGKREESAALRPVPQVEKSEFEERISDDEQAPDKPQTTDVAPLPSAGPVQKQPTSRENAKATRRAPQQLSKPKAKQPGQEMMVQDQALEDYTSSSESDGDDETAQDTFGEPATLAEAVFFGPEDVVQEFEKEKKETVEEEGDQVIDNTLPGWGSWTGVGVSKREQKRGKGRFTTTVKGVAQDRRQDAKLERVIVNEKRVKKNGKYLATELPHPFESRQQYERSLRLPLGPEWTTKSTFQDATKPRLLVKQGVIRPMAKPLA